MYMCSTKSLWFSEVNLVFSFCFLLTGCHSCFWRQTGCG